MKLRCVDGVVREFKLGKITGGENLHYHCNVCGQEFGPYKSNVLKQAFIQHTCYSDYLKVKPCLRDSKDETFSFVTYTWNITKMKAYAEKNLKPRMLSYEEVKAFYEGFVQHMIFINNKYAEEVDIRKPGLLIKLTDCSNQSLLVDGNHRLYKAYKLGKGFPVYELSFLEQLRFICFKDGLEAMLRYNTQVRLDKGYI